jgi:hypothetical protein
MREKQTKKKLKLKRNVNRGVDQDLKRENWATRIQ